MTFKHILVALDGTTMAEAALPQAKLMARLFDARVTLLHVIEASQNPVVHGQRHLTDQVEAERYLVEISQRFQAEGLSCDVHVHADAVKKVAGGIVAHEEELNPDLVVMCTHGPGKLERLLRGSLAQRVIALGQTPLLLAGPGSGETNDPLTGREILVALDGDAKHEQGFQLACGIAIAGKSRLHLLSVVPELSSLAGRRASLSRFLPGSSWLLQGFAKENLKSYLGRMITRAEDQGVEVNAEITVGKVASAITAMAETRDAGLIVLTTHGKAGTQAFWANSIAARVQGETTRPLLLVPV